MSQAKITPLSGFPEFLPADRIVEQHLLDLSLIHISEPTRPY